MKTEFKKHFWAYLILAIELIVFVILFLAAWPDRMVQRVLILFMSTFYIAWGSVTHFKSATFTKRVLYEYLAVAVLGAGLLLLLTF